MKISFKIVTFLVVFIVLGFTANLTVVEAVVAPSANAGGHTCTGTVTCSGSANSTTDTGSLVTVSGSGNCVSSDNSCSCSGKFTCNTSSSFSTGGKIYASCVCYGINYTVSLNTAEIIFDVTTNNFGITSSGFATLCGDGICLNPETTSNCSQDCPSVSGDTGPSSTRSLSTSTGSGFTVTTPAYGTASSLSIEGLIGKALDVLWLVFVGFAILMFIIAGMQFFLAQGDPGKVDTARQFVLWGVIGMAMGVLAFTLPFVVGGWLGLS